MMMQQVYLYQNPHFLFNSFSLFFYFFFSFLGNAVAAFQEAHGLESDGLAGDSTMQAMMAYLNKGF